MASARPYNLHCRTTTTVAGTAALTMLIAAGLTSPQADGQVRFEIVDLGTVPTFRATDAFAINEQIVVTGDALNTSFRSQAFRWESGGILSLGTLAFGNAGDSVGHEINDFGRIVGSSDIDSSSNSNRAFYYDGTSMTNLGTLGGDDSYAFAINNSNEVVGWSWRDNTINDPGVFLWTPTGGMVDLMDGFGRDINEEGDIVGYRRKLTADEAFIRDDGVIIDLGFLPGGSPVSQAFAINDREEVVGWAGQFPGNFGDRMGFHWQAGVMTPLGTLPDAPGRDYIGSIGLDINNAGVIVGHATYDTFSALNADEPAVWFNGWTLRLETLVTNLGGWDLRQVGGMNHRGYIVGGGFVDNQFRAYMLRPVFPDGAILVPNNNEGVVYVIDPETGTPFSTFSSRFAINGVEIIDGNNNDLLISDAANGVVWSLQPNGDGGSQYNNIPVSSVLGIDRSLAGFIVGATPNGFAAWDANGVGGVEPAYPDRLWDVVFSQLGSRFYLTTNENDANAQGHDLQLNFLGQTPVGQARDPRQTAIIDNNIFVCSAGNSRVYRYRLTNGSLISSFPVTTGQPIGIIELKNENLLISTTRGIYEYRKNGTLIREVVQGPGFQYLSYVRNYQP